MKHIRSTPKELGLDPNPGTGNMYSGGFEMP